VLIFTQRNRAVAEKELISNAKDITFMKILITSTALIAFFLGWSPLANAESTAVFNGKKFLAKITEHCSEGNVSCDDVTLESKSKKTGKGISLKGKTVNVNCPEVCDFRGYEFKNGVYTYYFVAGQANKWKINVFEKDKVISTDSGTLE
jgi:hypothetical protein